MHFMNEKKKHFIIASLTLNLARFSSPCTAFQVHIIFFYGSIKCIYVLTMNTAHSNIDIFAFVFDRTEQTLFWDWEIFSMFVLFSVRESERKEEKRGRAQKDDQLAQRQTYMRMFSNNHMTLLFHSWVCSCSYVWFMYVIDVVKMMMQSSVIMTFCMKYVLKISKFISNESTWFWCNMHMHAYITFTLLNRSRFQLLASVSILYCCAVIGAKRYGFYVSLAYGHTTNRWPMESFNIQIQLVFVLNMDKFLELYINFDE